MQLFLRPSNCVSVLTLRKNDKQKKKRKKKVMFSLMREIFHVWRDVLHSCGGFYMRIYAWRERVRNSVQAWDSRSMRESWQPCIFSYLNFLHWNYWYYARVEQQGGNTFIWSKWVHGTVKIIIVVKETICQWLRKCCHQMEMIVIW